MNRRQRGSNPRPPNEGSFSVTRDARKGHYGSRYQEKRYNARQESAREEVGFDQRGNGSRSNWLLRHDAGKDGENKFRVLALKKKLKIETIGQEKGAAFKQYNQYADDSSKLTKPKRTKRPDFRIEDTHFCVEVKTFSLRSDAVGGCYFFPYKELAGLCRFQNQRRESWQNRDYSLVVAVFRKRGGEAQSDTLKMFELSRLFSIAKVGGGLRVNERYKKDIAYRELPPRDKQVLRGYCVPVDLMEFTFENFKDYSARS